MLQRILHTVIGIIILFYLIRVAKLMNLDSRTNTADIDEHLNSSILNSQEV